MSNIYQTCPSQFYKQFRIAKQLAQHQNGMVLPIQQHTPLNVGYLQPPPQQQQVPIRRQYISQTLNSKDYQKMAKQAQIYNNNPRNIPIAGMVYQENPYAQIQQQRRQQRGDRSRLAEIRSQIEALNAEVAEICMRNKGNDELPNLRTGVVAPNPMAMKYGRIPQRVHVQDDMPDPVYDPYLIDNTFFSPSMSPSSFTQTYQQPDDDFYGDDWENEDGFSMTQPIQIQPIQTARPVAIRQAQPIYIQPTQPQFVPVRQIQPQVQYINPYRNRTNNRYVQRQNIQPMIQQLPQQQVQYVAPVQWEPVNYSYYQ
ncbi:hypothetical protein EHI8A_026680 [Entamoeba histolytica HM-1:IMSS-B]|uniref:Uncharacterized protein n=6 Tax=Entamoeba histolytica TaxID=5759 RepID=C4M689_ENTH1|nr:hypothetical protein EHI_081690 [Entamoeba histolytica HM-1:IMSS]EMD49326.1 Hypothetical protein EHI5A_052570 [Entamoeba histolytica KU27]EMH76146.1 hypothetical protein EHI8A_026680 [Entamoeba histolytica HM-1:IMSS-B]EMS16031.1 hypothetical protein KM1_063840 [Entamoeba histolytica HM-3:IMSS]ENY59760.1 hypothetical protein EHI7A_029470 [Entamoeba histolytica HM-1:IMSS-A]GAT96977.1 hypothetical protein CL6EHI_081690 [Entamoeba histolytica]|eukprot:XP_652021.1 hypothetical protein EHI_081690 [Entamoeba histolytica HM-1:IMSS]